MTVATTDRISNRRLREEFEYRRAQGWLTCELVALRLGWENASTGRPDGSRVLRKLGVSTSYQRDGVPCRQQRIGVVVAGEMARAMGLDPWEVGL